MLQSGCSSTHALWDDVQKQQGLPGRLEVHMRCCSSWEAPARLSGCARPAVLHMCVTHSAPWEEVLPPESTSVHVVCGGGNLRTLQKQRLISRC